MQHQITIDTTDEQENGLAYGLMLPPVIDGQSGDALLTQKVLDTLDSWAMAWRGAIGLKTLNAVLVATDPADISAMNDAADAILTKDDPSALQSPPLPLPPIHPLPPQ